MRSRRPSTPRCSRCWPDGPGQRGGESAISAENHEARRRRIAEIVVKVIAREGLEAATVRRIAAEVGFSTAVVTYYFENKQDLLFSALRLLGELNRDRFEEYARLQPPDLVSFLLSMTALEPADRAFWRAWVAFWERSLDAPEFAAELRSWIDLVLGRIEFFIAALAPACAEPERAATQLFDLVQGISTHMLFDPGKWPAEAVRKALADTTHMLLGAEGRL
jgi:AcrR family transcriptional regulator